MEENQIEHYRTAAAKIFDALVFGPMMDENATVVRSPPENTSFQPYSSRELSEWNYRLYGLNGINKANRRDLRLLLKQATELLELLRKKDHLE